MGKLRLRMDELRVESFAPAGAGDGKGTVRGHSEPTLFTDCGCAYTEDEGWMHTCQATCPNLYNGTFCGPDC